MRRAHLGRAELQLFLFVSRGLSLSFCVWLTTRCKRGFQELCPQMHGGLVLRSMWQLVRDGLVWFCLVWSGSACWLGDGTKRMEEIGEEKRHR